MIRRLVGAFVAVVLVVLLVQDVPLAAYLQGVERDRIVTGLERDAFVLAGRSSQALADTGQPDADGGITALAQTYRASSGARVVVVDDAGTAVVTSDEDAVAVGGSFRSRPEIASALRGTVATGTRYSTTLDTRLLYVAVPVISGSDVLGAVRLTYPDQVVTDAVNGKLSGLLVVGLTTALLAALIGVLLARSVAQPVRRLEGATKRFADGDRRARADERAGPPEVRALARSFNALAGRLDGLLAQQRAFAGDASHQLRTPLTALRLRLERAGGLVETDPPAAVERLQAATAELDRLDQLIGGLLALSRAEGGDTARRSVDLASVAAERAEQWNALAEESGGAVVVEQTGEALVLAVPDAVEQIVDNLVDNALGAAGPTGTVIIRIGPPHDGRIRLHVLDRGPGLSDADREAAFGRFWRGPGAEGRAGTGLGLAVVAQLAVASGATARLEAREGGGLDAVVAFEQARAGER